MDELSGRLTYGFEYKERLRAALVGCGGQAFRNILPAMAYAPVDLVATCDVDIERAKAYAAGFGGGRSYGDYQELLRTEELDVVFLVTGYGPDGAPLYPEQAVAAMEAGCHVWLEKPPAATTADVDRMHAVAVATTRTVGVGFMKLFSPAVRKVREIMALEEFGHPSTCYLRDPEMLPDPSRRHNLSTMTWVLDHLSHPASVLQHLLGPPATVQVERAGNAAAFVSIRFRSSSCAVLHFAWGQSGTSPKERLEVIGDGANVVVDNNSSITYFRPGHFGIGEFKYGRVGDYTTTLDVAPLRWCIDNYSGQPYNMHLFSQGYAPEIAYFCEKVLAGEPLDVGDLRDAWHVTQLFEALRVGDGERIDLDEAPEWARRS